MKVSARSKDLKLDLGKDKERRGDKTFLVECRGAQPKIKQL
jgi:hypothetical protein